MELARANKEHVKMVLDYLIAELDKFLDEHPDITDIDVFMAVHNFHVVTILSQEEAFTDTPGEQMFFRNMAKDTFNQAMENKPAYKKK